MRTIICWMLLMASGATCLAQVDTTFVYNTSMPYGTLDIRLARSATRYYYLQPDKTVSFRENAGTKTNTYRDMTSWDSKLYTEGNLRERNGSLDNFIMNYRLLFPNQYNATYSPGYPLIIMMHGLGERGNCWDTKCYHGTRTWNPAVNDPPAPTTATHQLLNNDHNLLHGGKVHLDARNLAGTRLPHDPAMPGRAFPGLVLFPQNMNGWSSGTAQDVIRMIRLICKKYNVDENRIYIHGLSNGGYGVYETIRRAPWLFAAALPMSAVSDAGITSRNSQSSIAGIPMWIFQGGLDTAPSPVKTDGYVRKFRDAGAVVRYSKYDHLGHGVWNTAYKEPQFFSWMLGQKKSNLHVYAGNPKICITNGKGVQLSLAEGFRKYQWERNGVIISGATSATYVATTEGIYRARFSRVANPSASDWNEWSQSVTVTSQNVPKPAIAQTGTVLLKDLNAFTDARLKTEAKGYAYYYWYKDGIRIDLPGTQDDTINHANIRYTTGNGRYTVVVAGYDNCPSPASDAKTVFFNDSAPINLAAPANFTGSPQGGASVRLGWVHTATGELGFEVWRKKASGTSPWTMAVLTTANATSYLDTGLEPSTTYHYKIRAAGAGGRSAYTPSADTQFLVVTTGADNIAPSAPANLTAVQTGVNRVTLKWNAATDDSGIKEYVIYYGSTSVATRTPVTTFSLTGLTMNTEYNFTVKAKDLGGNLSTSSNAASANTFITGLYYEHSTGSWVDLDAINWNVAEFRGKVRNFTLAPRTQEDYFNFMFDGYLYIVNSGAYQFNTTSSDGSRVELAGVVVVENDGVHGNKTVTGPLQTLPTGPRRIIVKYFEYDGTHALTVRYKGPDTGGLWKVIPDAYLQSTRPASAAAVENEVIAMDVETETTLDHRLQVYPNPAGQENVSVLVEGANADELAVSITDMNGRVVFQGSYHAEDIAYGVRVELPEGLNDGLYVVTVKEDQEVVRRKLVIRR